MSRDDSWLEALTEDALLVSRVADTVTCATYQPCRATVLQAHGETAGTLDIYARTLAYFDEATGLVDTYPLRTRATKDLLKPKYGQVRSIAFELPDLVSPEESHEAEAIFETLPDGFVRDWRWGLGIHKLYKPVIDMVRRIEARREPMWKDRLRLSPEQPTHIGAHEYVLNLDHFTRLRRGLQRIQATHQSAALVERQVLAHNSMLSDLDAAVYPARHIPYKADTIFKIVQQSDALTNLSRPDRSALVKVVERIADEVSAKEPEEALKLQKTFQIATLGALIFKFQDLLRRPTSMERDWQTLLLENPFLLSLVFGFPMVLVAEQANVGGMTIDGDGARYADFLMKNETTNSLALVEIKRPGTSLVSEGEYAGVRNIAGELTRAVMQVLDQRFRLLTNLPNLKFNSPGRSMEGWFVGCVVIAGRTPETNAEVKSFEIYRNSLKDVMLLTFDELLSRLVGLHSFLQSDEVDQDRKARNLTPGSEHASVLVKG